MPRSLIRAPRDILERPRVVLPGGRVIKPPALQDPETMGPGGPEPSPEPRRKPVIKKPDITIDVSGVVALKGAAAAEQLRQDILGRRITQYQRKRLEVAAELAKEKDISITEALSEVGAPVPKTIVAMVKEARTSKEIIKDALASGVVNPTGKLLTVGKETKKPSVIYETTEIKALQKQDSRLYSILLDSGLAAYKAAIPRPSAIRKIDVVTGKREDITAAEHFIKKQEEKRLKKLRPQIEAAEREYERSQAEFVKFEKEHVKLGDDTYITKYDFDLLTASQRNTAQARGIKALNEQIGADFIKAVSLPPDAQELYDKSGPEDKFAILMSYDMIPPNSVYMGSKKDEPLYREVKLTPEQTIERVAAFMPVPYVYTAMYWKKLTPGERSLYLAIDTALFFIPITAGGIRMATTGARASSAVTRAARLKAALYGVKTSQGTVGGLLPGLKEGVKASIIAPVRTVLHPVKTAKYTAKEAGNILENIFRTDKLAFAAVSDTYGTVRVPKLAGLSEADIMIVRDKLVNLAKTTGADIVIDYKGYRFTFRRSLLMKELGGGLTHATPAGEAFIKSTAVKLKPGKPLAEQGLFLSPEPLPRFTERAAFGSTGEMHSILVFSPEDAAKAVSSKKIFRPGGVPTAELEAKFLVNATTDAPKQLLFFRQGVEKAKVVVQLQKPLTRLQILKLKGKAIVRDFTTVFNPVLQIDDISKTGRGVKVIDSLTDAELDDLVRILRASGNREVAGNLSIARVGFQAIARVRAAAPRPDTTQIGRVEISARGRPPTSIEVNVERIPRRRAGDVERRLTLSELRKEARTMARTPEGRADARLRAEAVRADARERANAARERARTPEGRAAREEARVRADAPGRVPPRLPVTRTPPTRVPPTRVPPTRVPPTRAPPTRAPPTRVPPTRVPPVILPGAKKEKEWTKEDIENAVAWRQGIFVYAIKSPYSSRSDVRVWHKKKSPPGLHYIAIGKASPQKSFKLRGKGPAREKHIDIGVTDALFHKQTLRFRPDPGQKTTGDITMGGGLRNISKKRGRVFTTNLKGGKVLSQRPIRGSR